MDTDDRSEERTGADRPGVEHYEIRVRGRLSPRWASWFDGFELLDEPDGTTLLTGAVADQAALHGLLQRLRDLGVALLSLTRLVPDRPGETTALPNPHPNDTPGAPR